VSHSAASDDHERPDQRGRPQRCRHPVIDTTGAVGARGRPLVEKVLEIGVPVAHLQQRYQRHDRREREPPTASAPIVRSVRASLPDASAPGPAGGA